MDEECLKGYNRILIQNKWVKRAYKKRVNFKSFKESKLIWKAILLICHKDPSLRKYSPNWEGPFVVMQFFQGGSYQLVNLEGNSYERPINGKYLKKYYPSYEIILIGHFFGSVISSFNSTISYLCCKAEFVLDNKSSIILLFLQFGHYCLF